MNSQGFLNSLRVGGRGRKEVHKPVIPPVESIYWHKSHLLEVQATLYVTIKP